MIIEGFFVCLIRKAKTDDVAALELLISESVRSLSRGFYTPRQIDAAIAHIFGVDSQLIADGTYLVAELDRQIGGWNKRETLYAVVK